MENAIQKEPIICLVCQSGSRHFQNKDGWDIYACTGCNLRFVHPITVDDTPQIYSEDYFAGAQGGFGYADYDADKEPMVPAFEEYVRRIMRFREGRGRLLDVGAATGFFLSIAERYGYDVSGIEISPYAAAVGRSKGISVDTGTLADVVQKESPRSFGVVTMIDVIEHVPNPETEIKHVRTLLEEGGLVVINTPDTGSLYAQVMGPRWHLIVPPEHVFYFNRKNLRTLLERNGFTVVHESTIGKKFTLPYIFKTLHTWQGLGVWKFLYDVTKDGFLSRISIPINLGDNMFVIARAHEL